MLNPFIVDSSPMIGDLDTDAAAYIAAVEAADAQSLERKTKDAIITFILGLKSDGLWPSVKASCILAGARTLTGALVPLIGTAPVNVSGLFQSADYVRKTGLVGNGSTKHLNANRNNNADPQNSKHCAVWVSTAGSANSSYIGSGITDTGTTAHFRGAADTYFVMHNGSYSNFSAASASEVGLIGASRTSSTAVIIKAGRFAQSYSQASQTPHNANVVVFGRGTPGGVSSPTNARIAFYSIGEAIDLDKLSTRVSTLITDFGASIP